MHSISRLFGAALMLCLSSVTSAAQAVPDLWRPTATYYGYQYAMNMSHGDPFTKPYNAVLNSADPQNIPADHDTSADFYLFEPTRIDGAPTSPRPLIVYFHGADMAPAPTKQRAQIEHYVRSGRDAGGDRRRASVLHGQSGDVHRHLATAEWHLSALRRS